MQDPVLFVTHMKRTAGGGSKILGIKIFSYIVELNCQTVVVSDFHVDHTFILYSNIRRSKRAISFPNQGCANGLPSYNSVIQSICLKSNWERILQLFTR